MLTYLNDPALKTAFLGEIAKHEAQDQFIKGTYGQMNGVFKGCAIGCSLHSLNVLQGKVGKDSVVQVDQHARYETELGVPVWLAYLEDHLFENLPDDLAKTWPRLFAEAVPVGAVVTDVVLAKCLRWVLADEKYGARHATDDTTIRGHIDGVIAGFDAEIATNGHATVEQRETAAWAARAAMATQAAWAARAAWAAWDARDAGAAKAARAAWDARAAKAARAARAAWDPRAAFYPALSEYVLTLLRELPIHDASTVGPSLEHQPRATT